MEKHAHPLYNYAVMGETMDKHIAFREPMPMPDPSFPIKVHPPHTRKMVIGETLFPHHWHEHLEFLYFVSGSARIECGSSAIVCHAGDMCVVNSNELHYGICQSEDLSYYAIIMDLSLLQSRDWDATDEKFVTPIARNRMLFQNRIRGDESVTAHILSIIHELAAQETGYELNVKSHLYGLLSLLVRQYAATSHEQDKFRSRHKELERLEPVFAFIEEHYREKLSVQMLADIAGLSRYHFSRIFKQVTDKSVVEYINLIRINKSESLLRNKTMNISEVAHATGFSDIFYFSRTFKKFKQLSPTQWRNFEQE